MMSPIFRASHTQIRGFAPRGNSYMMLFAQAEGGGDHGAFVNFLVGDPSFAVVLLAMTLTAVTLVVWRLILNFHFKTDMNQFLPRFQDVLNKEGVEGAIRF